jgi:hypothetical protein
MKGEQTRCFTKNKDKCNKKIMDTLQTCSHEIVFSQETLRYFYSSVFQGFAALFTLAGMFYIYFSQNMLSWLDNLSGKVEVLVVEAFGSRVAANKALQGMDPIAYVENQIGFDKGSWANVIPHCNEYRKVQYGFNGIKKYLYYLLPLSAFILILSLFALFIIKLNNSKAIDYIVFESGVLVVILSCVYCFFLFVMVIKIFRFRHFRMIDDKELDKLFREVYKDIQIP